MTSGSLVEWIRWFQAKRLHWASTQVWQAGGPVNEVIWSIRWFPYAVNFDGFIRVCSNLRAILAFKIKKLAQIDELQSKWEVCMTGKVSQIVFWMPKEIRLYSGVMNEGRKSDVHTWVFGFDGFLPASSKPIPIEWWTSLIGRTWTRRGGCTRLSMADFTIVVENRFASDRKLLRQKSETRLGKVSISWRMDEPTYLFVLPLLKRHLSQVLNDQKCATWQFTKNMRISVNRDYVNEQKCVCIWKCLSYLMNFKLERD